MNSFNMVLFLCCKYALPWNTMEWWVPSELRTKDTFWNEQFQTQFDHSASPCIPICLPFIRHKLIRKAHLLHTKSAFEYQCDKCLYAFVVSVCVLIFMFLLVCFELSSLTHPFPFCGVHVHSSVALLFWVVIFDVTCMWVLVGPATTLWYRDIHKNI